MIRALKKAIIHDKIVVRLTIYNLLKKGYKMENYEEVMKKAERKYEHEQPLEAWEIILLLKKHANKGNAKAQFNLGVMYFMGEGVEQSYNTAFEWFTLSADQGNADAQFFLLNLDLGLDLDLRVRC